MRNQPNVDRRRILFTIPRGVDKKPQVLAEIARQVLVEQITEEIEAQALFTRYYQERRD